MKNRLSAIISIGVLIIGEVGLIIGLFKIFEKPITEFLLNIFRICSKIFYHIKIKLYVITHRKLYTYVKNGKVKTVWVLERSKEGL